MADMTQRPPEVAVADPARRTWTEEWAPVSRVRTPELVLNRIEAKIASGALRAGERLPSERELAELLGVSRPVVREALRVLEARGAVRSQAGQGPGSGTTIDRVPRDALTRLLRVHTALGSFPLKDIVEVRVALERSIVVLACRNAQPHELTRMRATLLAMDEAEVDAGGFNQLDIDFHVALADAGGNRLMSDLTRAICESVRVRFQVAVSAMAETGKDTWPCVRNRLRAEHQAVITAVEAGQADQAAGLLDGHIRGLYTE
jgi:GntR family transcriptional regulator, transcriptional repressor for pyruvate dehydrogenase complex